METVKAFIAAILSPLIFSLLLQIIGWLAIWKQKKSLGLVLLGIATIALTVGGLSGLTHDAARRLEYTFEPLDPATINIQPTLPTVITVLGTGFNNDPSMPANSQVSGVFLLRLLEGTRIYRSTPNSQLLISVAGDATEESKARFLSSMMELLAIDTTHVGLIHNAESTAEEAKEARQKFPEHQIVLVTSAGHMNRAMAIFSDVGRPPIPAPTGYNFPRHGSSGDDVWRCWIPSTDGISANHQWLYENTAMLWHHLCGG
jgi:uncharacterized SAM-binding protein YcdF (DUF218 family)